MEIHYAFSPVLWPLLAFSDWRGLSWWRAAASFLANLFMAELGSNFQPSNAARWRHGF